MYHVCTCLMVQYYTLFLQHPPEYFHYTACNLFNFTSSIPSLRRFKITLTDLQGIKGLIRYERPAEWKDLRVSAGRKTMNP